MWLSGWTVKQLCSSSPRAPTPYDREASLKAQPTVALHPICHSGKLLKGSSLSAHTRTEAQKWSPSLCAENAHTRTEEQGDMGARHAPGSQLRTRHLAASFAG